MRRRRPVALFRLLASIRWSLKRDAGAKCGFVLILFGFWGNLEFWRVTVLHVHPGATSSNLTSTLCTELFYRLGRHQIRVHLAHVGHPVASDGKYTSSLSSLWWTVNRDFRLLLETKLGTHANIQKTSVFPCCWWIPSQNTENAIYYINHSKVCERHIGWWVLLIIGNSCLDLDIEFDGIPTAGASTNSEDLRWCPNTFLHRHRLSFYGRMLCCGGKMVSSFSWEGNAEAVQKRPQKQQYAVRTAYIQLQDRTIPVRFVKYHFPISCCWKVGRKREIRGFKN